MSETVYLIWEMRNERRFRNEDAVDNKAIQSEIDNRWSHAVNQILTIDRALTNSKRFGRSARIKAGKGNVGEMSKERRATRQLGPSKGGFNEYFSTAPARAQPVKQGPTGLESLAQVSRSGQCINAFPPGVLICLPG